MAQPYESLEAELHDLFWHAADNLTEVGLMAKFLSMFPGKALEIGSGSGRLLLPLRELGFEIEGLELSNRMRELALTESRKRAIEICQYKGDMATWQPPHVFHSLLVPAFTLQLADDPWRVLDHWISWLTDTGGLYLSVFKPVAEISGDLPENTWYDDHEIMLDGGRNALLRTRHVLNHSEQSLIREHHYQVSASPPQEHRSTQRLVWFEVQQLRTSLEARRFEIISVFHDFDPNYTAKNPSLHDYSGVTTVWARRTSEAGI